MDMEEEPFFANIDDLRVRGIRPLMPPACVIEELPTDSSLKRFIFNTRCAISATIQGDDERLLVVAGPSSVHEPKAVLEYAARLRALAAAHEEDLLIVMQLQFGTGGGWKGLIKDPQLDGSFQINDGVRLVRRLLLDINKLGLPTGTEYEDTIAPQFIADLVSWAKIGGGSIESEAHRELASGLSTPVGFYSGKRAEWEPAVAAVAASTQPHAFLSVSKQGLAGIVETTGNRDCHVVVQHTGDTQQLAKACEALAANQLPARAVVDCGLGSPDEQANAVREVAASVQRGDPHVFGVVLHSFMLSGSQELRHGRKPVSGQSVTTPCMDWTATREAIEALGAAVRSRRNQSPTKKTRH